MAFQTLHDSIYNQKYSISKCVLRDDLELVFPFLQVEPKIVVPSEEPVIPEEIKTWLFSNDLQDVCYLNFDLSAIERQFYEKNIILDSGAATRLCELTTEQKSDAWYRARNLRITGSKAHKIWRARTNETRLNYFIDKSNPNVENFRYGHAMEPKGLLKFMEVTGYEGSY